MNSPPHSAPAPVLLSEGSIWRKWDLHIHTPASFHWNGPRLKDLAGSDRAEVFQSIVSRINELDIDAFCIMDYWTFDGYFALQDFLSTSTTKITKTVFPGIELRLEAPTDYRLNTHVLLDPDLSQGTLRTFIERLKIAGSTGRPPTPENLAELAASFDDGKLRALGYSPDDRSNTNKMYEAGAKSAVVTRESLEEAIATVGKDRCLVIQPYGTSGGLEDLDWRQHPVSDSTLMKMADMFETRKPEQVALFLGHGVPGKPNVGPEFIANLGGYPKPVVSGSDAHKIADYGIYPSNRITWLKAQPTFSGLQQVCYEPSGRCFIGDKPDKLLHIANHPTKYIKSLRLKKLSSSTLSEHWFDDFSIPLNPGLIAIIGNKGSGKSALADILALAGNTHCGQMEFLTPSRFRRGENKSASFEAILTWADNSETTVTLDRDPQLEEPERVRYLPQQYIEKLCNEIASGNDTHFERELKKVIFLHVEEDRRLDKTSLDELLDYLVDAKQKAVEQTRLEMHATNKDIVTAENESSPETIRTLQTALSLKEAELEAHNLTKPVEESKPDDGVDGADSEIAAQLQKSLTLLEQCQDNLAEAKNKRGTLSAQQALLKRLIGLLDNFAETRTAFAKQYAAEFTQAGFDIETVLQVTISKEPLSQALAQANSELALIAQTIHGDGEVTGLEAQIKEASAAVLKLQNELALPHKRYQQYLAAEKQWNARRSELIGTADKPDTIEYLKGRIERSQTTIPEKLSELKAHRLQLVRNIHAELAGIRGVYEELYQPVQDIARRPGFAQDSMPLDFNAELAPTQFEEDFLEFIHRNKRGAFYGEEESRKAVRSLVGRHTFNTDGEAVQFVEEVMRLLTEGDATNKPIDLPSQLRSNKKVLELYDFVFGLRYLVPKYTLRLGQMDVAELSPGEKGALLLVFYLLLDKQQVPIIIDQPEQNLDNESVVRLLVDCIRQSTLHRQVIIVTHNPNLAVVCDADQIIYMRLAKQDGNRMTCIAGAIEEWPVNKATVDVLEGTFPAFDNRRKKYRRPKHISPSATVQTVTKDSGPELAQAEDEPE